MSDEQKPLSGEEIEAWRKCQARECPHDVLHPRQSAPRLLATIDALRKDLEHLRSGAGPDSCADYVLRNEELRKEVEELNREAADRQSFVEVQFADFKNIIAELKARALDGWQLIKTAPQDGTTILGFERLRNNPIELLRFVEGRWLDPETWSAKPTHWMPLPPTPDEIGRRREK